MRVRVMYVRARECARVYVLVTFSSFATPPPPLYLHFSFPYADPYRFLSLSLTYTCKQASAHTHTHTHTPPHTHTHTHTHAHTHIHESARREGGREVETDRQACVRRGGGCSEQDIPRHPQSMHIPPSPLSPPPHPLYKDTDPPLEEGRGFELATRGP